MLPSREVVKLVRLSALSTPRRYVRVDEDTLTLNRADSVILPRGVDYVRAAAADVRNGVSYFATDTAPAVIAKVRHSDLALLDVIVLRDGSGGGGGGGEEGGGGGGATTTASSGGRFIRAGTMHPLGSVSYWATYTSPTRGEASALNRRQLSLRQLSTGKTTVKECSGEREGRDRSFHHVELFIFVIMLLFLRFSR